MTARPAATAVITRRVPRARRRPRHSAHAAKQADAAAEWPLGNDIPEKGASGPTAGRGRPTMSFTRLLARPTPMTVTARKMITPRDRVRSVSNTATSAAITITYLVLPRSVKRRRTLVLTSVACAEAHRATCRSTRTTYDCRRTSYASTATATSMARATVSARPVTRAGLSRSRTNRATPRWRWSWVCTASAVAWTGPWLALHASRFTIVNTTAASTAATTPAKTNTSRTDIVPPVTTRHRGSSRGAAPATAHPQREEDIG